MYHEFYVADQKRHIACSHFPQPFLSKDPSWPQANCHLLRQSMRMDTTYVFLTEESFVDNVHTSRAPIHQLHLQLQHDDYDPKVLGRWRWLAKWSSDPSNSRQVKPFLSNYTLNIFGWKTSILELKQCRPISRSTVSRFWNVFPNAPSSQAAPVLLVADALLTLLTVQVEKSTTMPSIVINFPLCGHFTLCTYYFPDSAPLQHRFPVLHAAGRK